jgi:hypothetical protein
MHARLAEEKDRPEEEKEEMISKTKDEIWEDFMKFLEIDNPVQYKRKAKGLRLAFDVKDTKSRIPLGMRDVKMKPTFKKQKLSAAEIKDKVKQMKDQRMTKKVKQEMAEKQKYEKNRQALKQIHEKLRHEKQYKPKGNKMSYADIKIRNMGIPSWDGKHTKVTLDVLQNMHYSDFNIDDDDDFNPTDILDDEDLKELKRQERLRRKKNKSINKISNRDLVKESPVTKNISKRGVQLNQSQMSEHRNRSSMDIPKGYMKNLKNQAYDYTQGGLGPNPSKKNIFTQGRDERSVPKVAQSFDADYSMNARASAAAAYPRSKQAMMKSRLSMGGSTSKIKQNKSVHYRRGNADAYANMNIQENYGVKNAKLPMMKQQMKDRVRQIENSHRDKERRNMDGIILMHDKHISKGLKTINKKRF